MQLLGDGKVVAVVLAGGDPSQVFVGFAPGISLGAKGLSAPQRQIMHSARARIRPPELRYRSGQLGIERDLYSWFRGRHRNSVPRDWYTM
jgi:hypothetical protein